MRGFARTACTLLLSCLCLAPAAAQQATAPAAAAREIDPNALVNAGLQVTQLIDGGKAGEVWDGASAIAKRSVERRKFVDTIASQRQPLGAVSSRQWTSVSRHSTPGMAQLPAGVYANVEFDVHFAGNRTGHELISFRQDEDGMWRLSGYVLK